MKNKTWTVADENTLREFTKAGFDVDYISGELDRTHKSIFNRLSVMRERGEDLPRLASRKRRAQVKRGGAVRIDSSMPISKVKMSDYYDANGNTRRVMPEEPAISITCNDSSDVSSVIYKWDLAIAFGFGLLAGVMGMGIWGVL